MDTQVPSAEIMVSRSEIQKALEVSVGARLQQVLPVVILVYLAASARSFVLSTAIVGWLAYTTGTVSLISWMLLRRDRIAPHRVHLLASSIGALVSLCVVTSFYVTADSQVMAIMLLLVVSACTLLSWHWYVFLAILTLSGWVDVAVQKLPLSSLIFWSLELLTTAAVAGYGIRLRLKKQYQVQKACLEDKMRKLTEQGVRERFELAARGTHDGFWYWDLKSNAIHLSPSWLAMLGYEEGELGTSPDEWLSRVHPGYVSKLQTELSAHLYGHSAQFWNEHRLRRKDFSYVWVLARGQAVRNESGEALGLAGSHTDITPLIEVENRLLTDAYHDQLTDLPNRHFLIGHLESMMDQKRRRGENAPLFALIFLDLDRFKIINDSLGHLLGDQLLSAVASRLRNCARPGDVVARFGGDEFVILLERVRDEEEALNVGTRIQSVLSAPFRIGDREVSTGASIGIVLSREKVTQTEDLLRYADIAMYHAKAQRKGQVQMFNENMQVQAARLGDLQNDLRLALERNELVLHYQPIVSTRLGKVLGVEALIRWQRSNQLVLPSDFIPLAEEIGLIGDIGDWALRTACAQNRAWQEAGIPPIRMAVNLSARQLQQKNFPQRVLDILDETKLQSRWLELELTETALMESLDLAPTTLAELAARGIRTSIDDFGTGYSSLNYLRRFNFHTVKMDRCFISDLATDDKAEAIARGLILLAHSLDLSVIAEGVERNDQLAFLATENCDQVQGFLASRPVPPEQLTDLLWRGDVRQKFDDKTAREKDPVLAEHLVAAGLIQ